MTIQAAFNAITDDLGGTPSTDGTIAGAIDALNDTLAGSNQERGNSIEQAVRLLGEHIGGGGVSLGAIIPFGASTDGGDPIMAEYRIGIGESIAATTFSPEMAGAAGGSSVDIVIAELGGDPVTGNETVTAELIAGETAAFTDFTKSLKEGALHIEFTMPNEEAEFLGFTVSVGK